MKREDFDSERPVQVAQDCFTGNGDEVLMVGQTYTLDRIPDIAFELGIVRQDPESEPEPVATELPSNQTRKQRTAQSQQSQPPEAQS